MEANNSMRGMFDGATSFNQNIGNWNTLNVTNFTELFKGATAFNNAGTNTIENWNTSAVNSMTDLFWGATAFNQPIGSWDVSNVTNMYRMFDNASSFEIFVTSTFPLIPSVPNNCINLHLIFYCTTFLKKA